MIKAIVFDFDDTLVKSEAGKRDGFFYSFSSIRGAEQVVKNFVARHYSFPRVQMIEGIAGELARVGLIAYQDIGRLIESALKSYGTFTQDLQCSAEEVSGASEVLRELSGSRRLYLNSATPQEAIERVMERRGWSPFFCKVYGAPPGTKQEHFQEIVRQEGIPPEEMAAVGDSDTDYEIAKGVGCHFVGVRGSIYTFKNPSFPVLDELYKLPTLVQSPCRIKIKK